MPYTGRDFCSSALREIGVVAADKVAEGTELATALEIAQDTLDSLSGDRLNLFTVLRSPFPLIPFQQAHTIGVGGDFNGNRPLWVPACVVSPVGSDLELQVDMLTLAEWNGVRQKSMTEEYPRFFYYQPTTDVLGTFWFYGIPTTAAIVTLSIPVPLQTIDANTVLTFPPGGYRETCKLQLAKRLQRPFSVPARPDLENDAFAALKQIQHNNNTGAADVRMAEVTTGSGGGRFDILTNGYRR